VNLQPGVAVTPTIRLVRCLGAGGMGSVWIADHLALHTQVVVKFMAAQLVTSADAVERFAREAGAAAQVKSPHVVQMLDHGITADGVPFIVMELLEGHDLARHLSNRGGRLPLGEIADIVSQVCKALGRAHERGIVHRDIKPENIFLCDVGQSELFVKILDFGIAKAAANSTLSGDTKTGATLGTPYYMSPEQMVGARTIDSRSDLWSLGVVVYQCVLGVRPFDAETFGALAVMIHTAQVPTPSAVDPSVPAAFDAWFFKACSKSPDARFANARELADALLAVARVEPWKPVAPMPVATQPYPGYPGSASGPHPSQGGLLQTTTNEGLGLGSMARPAPARGLGAGLAVAGAVAVIALAGVGFFATRAYRASHAAAPSPATEGAGLTPSVAPPPPVAVARLAPAASTADTPAVAPAPSASAAPPAAVTHAPAVPPATPPVVTPTHKPAPASTPTATKKDERDIF
jgi:eukaryotic-like serine/threonine-protein kinase